MRVPTPCVLGLHLHPQAVQAVVCTSPSSFALRWQYSSSWGEGAWPSPQAWDACVAALKAQLRARRLRVHALAVSVEDPRILSCPINLPADLSPQDRYFQQQAHVRELFAQLGAHPAIDATEPAVLHAMARADLRALQALARQLRCPLVCVSRDSAVRQTTPDAADLAAGIALADWRGLRPNLVRDVQERVRVHRRAWAWRCAASAAAGALWMTMGVHTLAWWGQGLEASLPPLARLEAQHAQALQAAREAEARVQAQAARQQWRSALAQQQQRHMQWLQVLAQAEGVWLSEVQQQGAHWQVQGEAMLSDDLSRLLQHLARLPIWHQPPALTQSDWGAGSVALLPVWRFQMKAELQP
jgi:hypothetical protein